jgi:DNA processing protein
MRKWEGAEKWKCFRGLASPVKGLWADGEISYEELTGSVAVVGSRRVSQYGRQVIEKLVNQLVNYQIPVVSGFMYGTDQAVHRAVIEAGGRTVAVLGWGIKYDKVDEEDKKLWKKIVDTGGAVVSEWENQTPAFWTFPARDRIIAALATDIYVVEAAVKSGALITAQMAVDLHKNVWAVPGSIFSSVSAGTNNLIAEGKAKMWLPNQQISLNLNIDVKSDRNNTEIYTSLQNEVLTADEIAKKVRKPIAEVLQELMMLSLEGKVVEREGKYSNVN